MTDYIRHRLRVAGGMGRVRFSPSALARIHTYSAGIPRLINLVCDRALLAGYVLEKSEIDRGVVRRAVKELGAAPVRSGGLSFLRSFAFRALSLTALTLAVLGAIYYTRGRSLGPWSAPPAVPSVAPPSEPGPDPAQASERFQARLLTLSPEVSSKAASAVLLELWGIRLAGGLSAISSLTDMPALAERAALQYSEIDTSLDQLQALDLPAVLEIVHPSRGGGLFLTLTGLDSDAAIVYFAPGDFLRVPKSALAPFWSGRARLFWRDFDGLAGSDPEGRLAWAGAQLSTLGLLPSGARSTPEELLDAVKKLQERVHLQPDGEVSEQTRMALYSLSGVYSVPRLREP
jgi:general secretion pathway protein A